MQSQPDEPVAVLNGDLISFREAKLPVFDFGVVQGASVVERLRTFSHRPFQTTEHLQRLARTLSNLQWPGEFQVEQLIEPMRKVASHNSRLIDPTEDLSIVLFVTPGAYLPDANGLDGRVPSVTTCIYTAPLPLDRYAEWYESGVHLMVPSIRHIPPECLDPHIKTRSRMNWYLADREVRRRDPGAMALLVDLEGNATETGSGNLFVVVDGKLITPRKEITLEGIAQQFVLQLAEKLNVPAERGDIGLEEFVRAEEAFLTSSTYCIAPVTRFEGKPVGNGRPGEISKRLLHEWSSVVNVDILKQARRSV